MVNVTGWPADGDAGEGVTEIVGGRDLAIVRLTVASPTAAVTLSRLAVRSVVGGLADCCWIDRAGRVSCPASVVNVTGTPTTMLLIASRTVASELYRGSAAAAKRARLGADVTRRRGRAAPDARALSLDADPENALTVAVPDLPSLTA